MQLALGQTVLDDIEAALCAKGASLCLLIDQFEELFRYAKEKSREEAELLTQLLRALASEENRAPHFFVILTMRSDYLGECSRFDGFAETVNACQYLLPRLDDFGLLRAIHEPATLYGGKIDSAVGDRLLFAARQEEDALPVLQHALMRACAHARERHGHREGWTTTTADLQAIEGKHGALSEHADEVLTEFQARHPMHLRAAEWLFRSLTELDAEGRVIRRPRSFAELIAAADGDRTGVKAVIEVFSGAGRNFLMTNPPDSIEDSTEIDVSHEALIRRWRKLSDPTRDPVKNEPAGWVWREFEDGQRLRALAVQARVFRSDKSATLSPATTEAYEPWWPDHTSAWAARYARDKDSANAEYREIEELWQASKSALEVERTRLERDAQAANERAAIERQLAEERVRRSMQRLRFQRGVSAAAFVVALLMAISGFFGWLQWERADTELRKSQTTQSLFLANLARQQRAQRDAGTAILLALEALPDAAGGITRPYAAEAELQLEGASRILRELMVLGGHEDAVWSAAFSPDGKRIVTTSGDNTVRLWDGETGKPIGRPLTGHEDVVYSATFSPDGKHIVTASADKTARLWHGETGKLIGYPLTGHTASVLSAAFSPDGRHIVTASVDKTVRLWHRETGNPIDEPLAGHSSSVLSAAFSPDGKRVVTASLDNTARLWDAEIGRPVGEPLTGHEAAVWSAAFSPDGKRIVTASADRTARVWDADTGKRVGEPLTGHEDSVSSAAFSPDGKRIITASQDKTVRLWEVETGKAVGEPLTGHRDAVWGAVFSPDGKLILTASWDKTARLWIGEIDKPISKPLTGHEDAVWSAAFSSDGKRVITASGDKTARLWNGETGNPIGEPLTGHEDAVFSAAFSPDGKRIITASADKTARLWDGETGKPIGEPLTGHEDAVFRAAFSPDGKRIVTASWDKTARLWDSETRTPIGEPLTGHTASVLSAAFSPDGKRIVTASGEFSPDAKRIISSSRDRTVRLWDSGTGKPIGKPLTGHEDAVWIAAFSPDGKRIVTASRDNTVRLWDGETGKPIGTPLTGHEDAVWSAAFSPDGKRILTASRDRTARLWDGETGNPISEPLTDHEDAVLSAAFSPDGKRMVTASRDRTARVWEIFANTQDMVTRAKAVVPRCLPPTQLTNFSLPPEPPLWCVEKGKWPYQTDAWKNWLREKRAGGSPPLPPTP